MNTKIHYSKTTIEMIQKAFPLRTDLIEMANEGKELLVSILRELSDNCGFTPQDIVNAFEKNVTKPESLRNLYEDARQLLIKVQAHDLAMDDFYQSFSPEEINEEQIRIKNEVEP